MNWGESLEPSSTFHSATGFKEERNGIYSLELTRPKPHTILQQGGAADETWNPPGPPSRAECGVPAMALTHPGKGLGHAHLNVT